MSTHVHIRCPACQGSLVTTELRCEACDLTVRGRFAENEFASLGEEDLHFLRIFVLCEGRIREMESALGVSYPSIKAKLARLKTALTPVQPNPASTGPQGDGARSEASNASVTVLKELEAGRITYDVAMERLKRLQAKSSL